jgi:type IV secretory pathway TraG/TraD family ATPase VirD4
MRFFGKKKPRQGEPQPLPPDLHPWDSQKKLLDLTQHEDWLTLGDLFTGLAVFGATGSGKTSSLAMLAYILMKLECGFVWMCVKPDEIHLVRRIARAAGREEQIIVIGQDTDGRITPHRFNPLQYEADAPTTGTTAIAQYLTACAEVLSRRSGEKGGTDGDRYWTDQFERLLRNCIDTARLAGRLLTVALLRKIQTDAPISEEQIANLGWLEKSVWWECMEQIEERANKGDVNPIDLERLLAFWTKDYMLLSEKTRSVINSIFANLTDAFLAEEPVRSILSGTSTVTPEDVIKRGKIVVLSLPANIFHHAGVMVQFCFKRSFQLAMLRRAPPKPGQMLRPTVLWVDEAHALAHAYDQEYFSTVRSNRGINIYLNQGIGTYIKTMNLAGTDAADTFLQNLATKIFFQNNSTQTNHYASACIGRLLKDKNSSSWGHSMNSPANIGGSRTTEERNQVTSGDFAFLKRGGAENDFIVEGYVLRPKLFNLTDTNFAKCQFLQTDITR